jgi:hypothetical protein
MEGVLCKAFADEEIKFALFQLEPNKAATLIALL